MATPPQISPEIQALLNQMQDIIVPDAVGWWPLSFSLASVLVGLIGLLIGIFWAVRRSWLENLYRQEAKELYDKAIQQANSPQQKLEIANRLLKQVAITHYGRKNIANLAGENWTDFLRKTANYIDQPKYLAEYFDAHYQASFDFDDAKLTQVLNYTQSWIKGHHK